MNILYHHRTLADGAEGIHIQEMADAFRRLGHRVTMVSVGGRRAGDAAGKPGVLARVRPLLPQSAFEASALLLNVSEYVSVRRRLRKREADLVYKRHALLDVGAALAAWRSRVPLVLELNTAYSSPALRRFEPVALPGLVRWFERLAVRRSTVAYAVSTPLAAYLSDLARRTVRVLPNGADPERFDPARISGDAVRARYGLSGATVIGWAGVLRRWHGVELLLEALTRVPDARLLLIGDGPERPVLERRARELGVDRRLAVTGRVAHEEMPAHLAAVDIAVAAADRTGYASPMKILEYMAMGRAVAAPCLPNIEDVLEDGRTGLLFAPDQPESMIDALTRLAGSPELRAQLGAAARRAVEERFNWTANAQAVLAAVAQAGACAS